MTNDRTTQADFDQLRDVMEDSFSTLARLHDAVLDEALSHYQANDQTKPDTGERYTGALEKSLGQHASRKAAVVKAVMQFRFPEAADAWFA